MRNWDVISIELKLIAWWTFCWTDTYLFITHDKYDFEKHARSHLRKCMKKYCRCQCMLFTLKWWLRVGYNFLVNLPHTNICEWFVNVSETCCEHLPEFTYILSFETCLDITTRIIHNLLVLIKFDKTWWKVHYSYDPSPDAKLRYSVYQRDHGISHHATNNIMWLRGATKTVHAVTARCDNYCTYSACWYDKYDSMTILIRYAVARADVTNMTQWEFWLNMWWFVWQFRVK